ncbi:glycosyltransferase family 4 protein [Halomonas sp. KAO]|uniref:glycosyltransferase family 4 protein n=1 Tax=unclassified Halomonas TaxID=2609666 RepID=UPI00189F611F|nr:MULTISPECIES: glycosyltransferase family 4 protein [unclassified Halomonas]MBF7053695.1 glycosyltransferase family 4 protein [Halomonas sp. KAO]MDT0500974.1 glycosyltransferase family 4 protein [Halomonas sp. PAR7]MDT0512710.1 glycosyltransferase family 4 protein [Halomonas sp. LES1]MDT0591972.1 glycosyltransferase family 4 protein [Halomonas sp. PAR8]
MHIIHANLARGFRGGERQTVLLIQALADKAEVSLQTLVCRPDSPMRAELATTHGLRFVSARHQLAGHRQAGRATMVHAHDAKAVHWAWLHHRLFGIPYLITRRVDTPVKHKLSNRIFYREAHRCVALSRVIAENIQPLSPHPVAQIPSAFTPLVSDPNITRAFRARYPGRFLVGHAGALVDRHKGQRVLLDAARRLQHSQPDMLFVFFGQGEDEAELKQESIRLDNVIWAGFKSDIGNYLPALDIFAFPSRNEGLGSVLLDAIRAEVPVVASKTGGIPDIVRHEETGLLFPTGDSEYLAECLVRLRDIDLRKRLVEKASQHLAKYSPEAMANSYTSLYSRV